MARYACRLVVRRKQTRGLEVLQCASCHVGVGLPQCNLFQREIKTQETLRETQNRQLLDVVFDPSSLTMTGEHTGSPCRVPAVALIRQGRQCRLW